MPTFTEQQIIDAAAQVLEAAGTPAENARLVAELLAEANATGHDSHGVIRIPQYLDSVDKGDVAPTRRSTRFRKTRSWPSLMETGDSGRSR